MSASANRLKPARLGVTFFTVPSAIKLSIVVTGLASMRCAYALPGTKSPRATSAASADHADFLRRRECVASGKSENV